MSIDSKRLSHCNELERGVPERRAAPPRPLFGSIRFISFVWLVCCAWTTHPTSAKSAESIKIGAVLPFSGGVELYGRQAKLGLDLAAADINAAGGILGRPVEIVYRDDGTRPNIATEAARRM